MYIITVKQRTVERYTRGTARSRVSRSGRRRWAQSLSPQTASGAMLSPFTLVFVEGRRTFIFTREVLLQGNIGDGAVSCKVYFRLNALWERE